MDLEHCKAVCQEISELEDSLCTLVTDICNEMCDGDELITSLIGETNAFAWGVDEVNIERVDFQWENSRPQPVIYASFTLSGEQDEDHGDPGHSISGSLTLTIAGDGSHEVSDLKAEINIPE